MIMKPSLLFLSGLLPATFLTTNLSQNFNKSEEMDVKKYRKIRLQLYYLMKYNIKERELFTNKYNVYPKNIGETGMVISEKQLGINKFVQPKFFAIDEVEETLRFPLAINLNDIKLSLIIDNINSKKGKISVLKTLTYVDIETKIEVNYQEKLNVFGYRKNSIIDEIHDEDDEISIQQLLDNFHDQNTKFTNKFASEIGKKGDIVNQKSLGIIEVSIPKNYSVQLVIKSINDVYGYMKVSVKVTNNQNSLNKFIYISSFKKHNSNL